MPKKKTTTKKATKRSYKSEPKGIEKPKVETTEIEIEIPDTADTETKVPEKVEVKETPFVEVKTETKIPEVQSELKQVETKVQTSGREKRRRRLLGF